MGRIAVLPDSLINKIAAGEVIERPGSVIKELVENSLDAGAGRIDVYVEGGGRALLRVVDDGCGMGRDDARTCLERHATSKIRSDADLFAIDTLGFRGEAIPSIAEVSRFEVITGERGADAGTRIVVDGGVWERIEDAPNPGGTDIAVRRLFFNTPVRLKFLKAPRTELGHISAVVLRMALAHPEVAFRLEVDGKGVLDLPRADSLRERVRKALGKRTAEGMEALQAEDGPIRLEGLVGVPSLHRSGNGGLYLYVNGRAVKDRTLVGAVLAAYRGLLPPGRYPVVVLFLDLPPEDVDVNVHPTKVDVRFQRNREVFRFLGAALTDVLARADAGPAASLFPTSRGRQLTLGAAPEPAPPPVAPAPPPIAPRPPMVVHDAPRAADAELDPLGRAARPPGLLRRSGGAARPVPTQPAEDLGALRAIGHYAGRWLLAQGGDRLVVVDAVAAHERVLYERLLADAPVGTRRLLVPELLELEEAQVERLDSARDLLSGLGLEIASFGGDTLALHAGPRGAHPQRCRGALVALPARFDRTTAAAHFASWLALDPEEPLTDAEQRLLLSALRRCADPRRSPWGTPVLARFGPDEVARWPRP